MSDAAHSLTIGFTVCNAIFILCIGMPEWHSLFLEPNLTIASILACRLVRELKLGVYEDLMSQHTVSKIVIRDITGLRTHDSGDISTCDVIKRHNEDVENEACQHLRWVG
jgi:hypothetical protein